MESKCSIVEMKFFHDHLRKTLIIIKAENKKHEVFSGPETRGLPNYRTYFSTLAQAFGEIGQLACDLNDHKLSKYILNFVGLINLGRELKHERTLKKLALMALEHENLISQLICCYDNPKRYEDILRAYEVLSFKEERLLRRDFGSNPREEHGLSERKT